MADEILTKLPKSGIYDVEFEGKSFSVRYSPGFPGTYWEPPEPDGIENIYLKVEGGWIDLEIDLLEERIYRGIEKALYEELNKYWEAYHDNYARSL